MTLEPVLPITQPCLENLLSDMQKLWTSQKFLLLGIDGKCGSGKSTLADYLANRYPASIIHMDHFFLPPYLKTTERLREPGGNLHYERFLEEVYEPLMQYKASSGFSDAADFPRLLTNYHIYSCRDGSMDELHPIYLQPLIIIEGSYCMRPEFRKLYDITIFLDLSDDLQLERLRNRVSSEALTAFKEKWIPLENRYFSTGIPSACTHYCYIK